MVIGSIRFLRELLIDAIIANPWFIMKFHKIGEHYYDFCQGIKKGIR